MSCLLHEKEDEMGILEERLERFGSKPGLERIGKIMKALGNPHKKLRVILVGGTNGKGSVTAYLSSILKSAGYTVGSFYSPPLTDETERYRINGVNIGNAKLGEYERKMISLYEGGLEMTKYEAMTVIAYSYFHEKKVDFAVVEVMMGGTYDATNIADCEIGVITNVSLDHTTWLGESVEEIAYDKAGILKKGICITGATGGALKAIKKRAGSVPVRALNKDFFYTIKECIDRRTVFDYEGKKKIENLKVKLVGDYQAGNASIAVAVCEELGISEKAIRKGLRATRHSGRMQLVRERPKLLIDAAHNPAGMQSLVSNLKLFDYKKLVVLFGAKQGKDWEKMIEILAPKADSMVVCTSVSEGTPAEELAEFAKKFTETRAVENPSEAYAAARKMAGLEDMILVCGSIYLIKELIRLGKIRA